MKDSSAKLMMDLLSKTYADEAVQKIPELQVAVLDAARELEKNENCRMASSKLWGGVNLYLMAHGYTAPKAIIDLYYELLDNTKISDSLLIRPFMFPTSL